jgi:MYXO-CTERM domain-containing protein
MISSRRVAALSLLALVWAAPALASPWTWLSPTPGGFAINAVAFPTSTEGFFVGAQGTVLVTQDGGRTFEAQVVPTQANLYGVFFLPDGKTGWIVGDGGTILHTTDGGTTWAAQSSPTQRLIYAVYFTDALHGFCAGEESTLLQTADGGATWTGRDGQLLNLNALAFPDAQHGFAVGWGGNIILTVDGGNSWTVVFTGVTEDLLAAAFVDANDGWAVGAAGTILKTSDGGQSWQVQGAGVTTQDLVGVVAVSSAVAYAVTASGAFLYTSDGSTWAAGTFEYQDTLTCLALAPGGELWTGGTDGHVFYAPGGGSVPGQQVFVDANQGLPSDDGVVGMAFASPQVGVIVTGGQIFYTTNGGAELQYASVPGPTVEGRPSPTWTAAAMPTSSVAFAVGTGGGVITSTNGGVDWTWLSDDAAFTELDLYAVCFVSATQGWIAGEGGVILSTSNGGNSWTTTNVAAFGSLRAIYFSDATHGVAVGDYGTIVTTSDGQTWTAVPQQFVAQALYAVGGVPPGNLYAVGQAGYMVESPDMGNSWYQIAGPVNADMHGVFFADPLDGYLVTAQPGQILVTHDGGNSWSVQLSGLPSLFAMSFLDLLNGFVGGAGGAVLSTSSGGEPTCGDGSECPGLDGGDVAYVCQAGDCIPCNTDQQCGATCGACEGVTPFCLGGFCGQCRGSSDCSDGGVCISGGCVINTPLPDDGGVSTTDAGTKGGGKGGSDGGGNKVVTVLPDGGIEINPAAACGCRPGGDGTASPWAVAGLALLGAWALSRRRAS